MSIVEKALNAARRRAADKAEVAGHSPPPPPAAAEGRSAATVAARQNLPSVEHRRIAVDLEKLRAAGGLPPQEFDRELSEQYRRIKRPLVAYAIGGHKEATRANRHLVMVASAFPGEGKTFTSINLALSLSLEKDTTVLLADTDIANPRLSHLFGMQNQRGLFDALSDETPDAEALIVDTGIPGLAFLPAGSASKASSELLASNRMHSLMSSLIARDPKRIVVLDSPPLLLTNESRELASIVGQIVLVVQAGVTPQESVQQAVALIPEGRHVGIVLNQVDPSSADVSYYGYGRYGAYAAGGERKE
jgi:exopolysaccharide/PEP-CTERM locus tyrosine autokinase